MKYALFLLALIVGSVSGIHLEATVTGSTEVNSNGEIVMDATTGLEETCGKCVMEKLYERCVENKAVARGFHERRELRDDRRLCPTVCQGQSYWRGHWCWVKGCRRRLTLADEHSERSLVDTAAVVSELQQAAQICYEEKAEDFPCLGAAGEISVEVFYVSG
jgi:hypothetical protein